MLTIERLHSINLFLSYLSHSLLPNLTPFPFSLIISVFFLSSSIISFISFSSVSLPSSYLAFILYLLYPNPLLFIQFSFPFSISISFSSSTVHFSSFLPLSFIILCILPPSSAKHSFLRHILSLTLEHHFHPLPSLVNFPIPAPSLLRPFNILSIPFLAFLIYFAGPLRLGDVHFYLY